MRGPDEQTQHMFSYLSPEQRVPADHPLRAIRALKQQRPRMSDVWYARQIAKQAVAAGCHASTIRKHMTGRPGTGARRR